MKIPNTPGLTNEILLENLSGITVSCVNNSINGIKYILDAVVVIYGDL